MRVLDMSVMCLVVFCGVCLAEEYGGIEFPDGAISFADHVIRYDPMHSGGPVPTEPTAVIPSDALGAPDFPPGGGIGDVGAVSLGRGGLIELQFIDNILTNSGDGDKDLHIFEVGSDVEDTFVAIRPKPETAALLDAGLDANGDGFYEIGKVYGSISSIDIDAIFPGFAAGELAFDAVQLIDDYNEGGAGGVTVGADIDAVGAIATLDACDYALLGDLNGDCVVNLLDFALMAAHWLIDCNTEPLHPACKPED